MDKPAPTQTSPPHLPTELELYAKSTLFGVLVFLAFFAYSFFLGQASPLNKALADTAITLVGFSMLLSSICYFWDFLDSFISYRKYLGLVGFAFFLAHFLLSLSAFARLFSPLAWSQGTTYAPLNGLIATLILTFMAAISTKHAAQKLGGQLWRRLLRTGYGAIFFVWLHVFFIQRESWFSWIRQPTSLPPSSLIVGLFIFLVLFMRLCLFVSLKTRRPQASSAPPSPPLPNLPQPPATNSN